MNSRKIVASVFVLLALVLGIIFFLEIEFPTGLTAYFKKAYYSQFGPLAIAIELLIAGIYLFMKRAKTNFVLALFGFTAVLDPVFDFFNLFSSNVPGYATVIFLCCAAACFYMAFSNAFKLGRITFIGALVSFILGNAVELFFNYI